MNLFTAAVLEGSQSQRWRSYCNAAGPRRRQHCDSDEDWADTAAADKVTESSSSEAPSSANYCEVCVIAPRSGVALVPHGHKACDTRAVVTGRHDGLSRRLVCRRLKPVSVQYV